MSGYARVNLYVGKYEVPADGHIRLENAHLRVIRGKVMDDGWQSDPKGEPWLMVEDGNFWPVMIKVDYRRDDVADLILAAWKGHGDDA